MLSFRKFLLVLLTVGLSFHLQVEADCKAPPLMPNTKLRYGSRISNQRVTVPERTTVLFSCVDEFEISSGDRFASCLGSIWKSKDKESGEMRATIPLRCVEKHCPIEDPEHGNAKLEGRNVFYSCERGFRLVGIKQTQCRPDKDGNYIITAPLPKCIPLKKCKRPDFPALNLKGECCYSGDKVNFSCEKGYKLEGPSMLECKSDGVWRSTPPFCKVIPRCNDPGTKNHVLRIGKCEDYGCTVGTTIIYKCEKDFEFEDDTSDNFIECMEDETWSGKIPTCKPKGSLTCPPLPEENKLQIEFETREVPGIFLPYDSIELECQKNFQTNSQSLSLMCQEDGTWDREMPVCEPMDPCTRPENPANGRILELENDFRKIFPIGSEINVECENGYVTESGIYGSTCIGSDWQPNISDCRKLTCSDPGVPANAQRLITGNEVGDTVTYTCMGNAQLIGSQRRTCLKNGRWSGYTTVCHIGDSTCLDPGVPLNSYREGNSFNAGDVVVYTCKPGYTLFGNETRVCLKNGYWTGEEIECSGNNEYTEEDNVINTMDGTLTSIARSVSSSDVGVSLGRSGGSAIKTDHAGGVSIFFVLDVSGSITVKPFKDAKEFIKMIIRKVGITPDPYGIRAGVISFSSNATVEFTTNVKTVDEAIRRIDNITRHEKRGTNLKEAFIRLAAQVSLDRATRPKSKAVAFLITDGRFTEGGEPTKEVNTLKLRKIEIYSVGIGDSIDRAFLKKISTEFFMFASHKELIATVGKAIDRKIDFGFCGLERPHYILEPEAKPKGARPKRSLQSVARIVGGTKVYRPWPWMAAFEIDAQEGYKHLAQDIKGVQCGGFIIHTQWILSAAHCFMEKLTEHPPNWKILIGRTNIRANSGLEYRIDKIIKHPNFDPATMNYDIALVKLPYSFSYDNFMRPVCLPPLYDELEKVNSSLYEPQEMATVVGWGHTKVMTVNDTVTKSVDHLNELDIPIQENDICREEVNYVDCSKGRCVKKNIKPADYTFCAGSGKGGNDSCKGDSGGPLMQKVISTSGNITTERWFAIGIVSWGVGCGDAGFYGYYTHVAKLRSWITKETKVDFENVHVLPAEESN